MQILKGTTTTLDHSLESNDHRLHGWGRYNNKRVIDRALYNNVLLIDPIFVSGNTLTATSYCDTFGFVFQSYTAVKRRDQTGFLKLGNVQFDLQHDLWTISYICGINISCWLTAASLLYDIKIMLGMNCINSMNAKECNSAANRIKKHQSLCTLVLTSKRRTSS